MKPNQIMIIKLSGRPIQLVSYPTPNHTIMARMVPGDPTSMREIPIRELDTFPLDNAKPTYPLYVQVAKVSGSGIIPRDMMRRERAFHYEEEDFDTTDPREVMIFRLAKKPNEQWNPDRWSSYNWHFEYVGTHEVSKV